MSLEGLQQLWNNPGFQKWLDYTISDNLNGVVPVLVFLLIFLPLSDRDEVVDRFLDIPKLLWPGRPDEFPGRVPGPIGLLVKLLRGRWRFCVWEGL